MVWEQNVAVICSLNKLLEKGRVKGDSYWPTGSNPATFGLLTLEPIGIRSISETGIILRKFKLTHAITLASREVVQLHYRSWPDFGVPKSSLGLRELLHLVKFYSDGSRSKGIDGPVVVHCSAGIGRAGTFLSAFSIIETQHFHSLINNPEFVTVVRQNLANESSSSGSGSCGGGIDPAKKMEWVSLLSQFNIPEVVLELRKQRNRGIVQTEQQYAFIYQVVIDEILSACVEGQKIPSSVQDIIRQELQCKLEMQLREDELSPSESDDEPSSKEFSECEDAMLSPSLKNSSPSGCLRRSPAHRGHRWSPLAVSPLVVSPSRSPQHHLNNLHSPGRSFLTSSAPSTAITATISVPESLLSPTNFHSPREAALIISNSGERMLPSERSNLAASTSSAQRSRPRRRELYSDSIDMDIAVDHYASNRNYLAQTVQF